MTVVTVPNKPPSHLRIHIEESDHDAEAPRREVPIWERLCNAYQGLTGWQLDVTTGTVPLGAKTVAEFSNPTSEAKTKVFRRNTNAPITTEGRDENAETLATAVGELMRELQLTRATMAERECELAALQPFRARLDDVTDFHHRMQSVLRGAVEGLEGRAAAFYMLDDETTLLKLRLHWGLSSLRFLEPSRPLRGAVADLEALTGHAVVLEDTKLFTHWNVPEAFESAVCVPVSSADTLLGTLWFFSDEVRDYSAGETQLLEIVAGRIAAEFERRSLTAELSEQRKRDDSRTDDLLLSIQQNQAPPMIDGWQVAGEMIRGKKTRGDFHLWHFDSDDRLGLCCSSPAGSPDQSRVTSSLLQGAVRGVMASDLSIRQRLQATNETLWASQTEADGASMFLGSLDPVTGELDYATGGGTDAFILRPHGWEPISLDAPHIGADFDWEGQIEQQQIHPGDVLFVISNRSLHASDTEAEFDTVSIAETLLRHLHLSAEELAELAVDRILKHSPDPATRSILIAKREG